MARWASAMRAVVRAYGATAGNRSVKVRFLQAVLRHWDRRTAMRRITRRPCRGRSATVRV